MDAAKYKDCINKALETAKKKNQSLSEWELEAYKKAVESKA